MLLAVAAAVIGGIEPVRWTRLRFDADRRLVGGHHPERYGAARHEGPGVEIQFSDAGPKFVVTGLILLLAASVDALSRKRATAH